MLLKSPGVIKVKPLVLTASLSGDVFAMMIVRMLWASVAMDSLKEVAFVGLYEVGPRLS